MRMQSSLAVLTFALTLTCAGACAAATVDVRLTDFSFSPRNVTINVGDSVRWTNINGVHNVVADNDSFTSGAVRGPGWTFIQTFNTPGSNPYYCSPHGSPGGQGMAGSVNVQGTAPPPTFTINDGVHGIWHNPATSGQGFVFEVNSGSRLLAVGWFTWTGTAGEYLWYSGVGTLPTTTGNRVEVQLSRTRGGRFNDPTSVTTTSAGSAVLTFTSCTAATWQFTLTDPAGTGTINLQKLLPQGSTCSSSVVH